MSKRLFSISFLLSVLVIASGCTTLADARAAKGSGLTREYPVSVDVVWKEIPAVLTLLGLSLVGENKAEGYLLAQRSVTLFSAGENVAIFVEGVGNISKTRVEVVSKKTISTNIFAPSWEKGILDKLDERLRPAS